MSTVMVVEDDRTIQRILELRLRQWHFEVLLVGDGATAVDTARTHQPHLILMDMRLPTLNGWEATQQIKSDPATAHIPIVAMTAANTVAEKQLFEAAGCDAYLPKPTPSDQLEAILHRFLPPQKPTA